MDTTGIHMYGTVWCSDCKRTSRVFGEHRVRHDFIDIDGDEEGRPIVTVVPERASQVLVEAVP